MNGIDTTGYTYLGVAVKFPISLYVGGRPVMASGNVSVEQSIKHILDTPIGSLFFKPEYGSNLSKLLFRQNNESLWQLIKIYATEAITTWESRVKDVIVSVVADGENCLCRIDYKVKGRNEVNSMVYPFYRNL